MTAMKAGSEPAAPSYPQALVRDAVAQTMVTEHIHCIVVRADPDQSQRDRWAIVSDVTLLRNAGQDFSRWTAGRVAVADYPTVTPSETVERAVELMIGQDVRHLMVVDERTRRPLGVLSTLDVARVLARAPN
jgi:signal-transduction protein with cAMP-binding, CBS, and nucleotidyltransferase domain